MVVIELGANDALRGLPLDGDRGQPGAMTQAAQKAGARVLLVGMQVPPNYGRDYASSSPACSRTSPRRDKAPLVPFLLQGVADAPNARDCSRPIASTRSRRRTRRILDNVWPVLAPLLR